MGFDAGKVAETLNWNFTAYGSPEDKGTIPEPDSETVDTFQARFTSLLQALWQHQQAKRSVTVAAGAEAAEDNEKLASDQAMTLAERLDAWHAEFNASPEDAVTITDEFIRMLADVCGGSPTEAQIRLLPSRQFRAFMGWVNEQLTAPKFTFAGSDSNS